MSKTDRHDERIRKLLSSLPREQAPPDFEERLLRRIAHERPRREGLLPAWMRSYTAPALSLLLVGVLSYLFYLTQMRTAADNDRQATDTISAPPAGPVPGAGGTTGPPSGAGSVDQLSPASTPGAQSASGAVQGRDLGPRSATGVQSVPGPGAPVPGQKQAAPGIAPEERILRGRDAEYLDAPGVTGGRTAATAFRQRYSPGLLAAPKGFFTPGMPGLMKTGRRMPGRLKLEEAVSDSAARADSTARRDTAIPGGLNAPPDSLRQHTLESPDPVGPD